MNTLATPQPHPSPSSPVSGLALYLLILLGPALGSAATHAQASDPGDLEAVRASIERQRQAVALIDVELEKDPRQAPLWEAWIMQRSMLTTVEQRLAVAEGKAVELDQEARTARALRQVEVLYSRWIEAVPNDPAPWIQRAMVLFPKDGREDALRDVVRRFPEDFAPVNQLSRHLRTVDRVSEEMTLLEEFAAANVDNAPAYPALHRRYSDIGAHDKARALAERWLAEFPADPEANRIALQAESQGLPPAQRRELARQRMDRLGAEDRAQWCSYLGGRDEAASAAVSDCYASALDELPESSEAYAKALQNWTELAAKETEGAGVEGLLTRLEPDRRDAVRRAIARDRLSAGRCDDAAGLVRATTEPYEALVTLSWSAHYDRCARSAAMRELVLEAGALADPARVVSLIRERGTDLPEDELADVLVQRLAREPDQRLWRALEDLYARSGRTDEQIRHLERWLASGSDRKSQNTSELAHLLLLSGQSDRALALLEEATRDPEMPFDYDLHERLAKLHLRGASSEGPSPELAQAVGQRLLADGGPRAFYGHLLLARCALTLDRVDTALVHYERFFDEAPGEFWRNADEYRDLLVLEGEHDTLERFLERRWEAERDASYYERGRRELWLAESLAEVGLNERALAHYDRLIAEGEGTAELFTAVARLSEEIEDWERAEAARRSLLQLAPRESASWLQLARHLIERGEPERAFEELDRAFAIVARPEPRLWIAWADAVMALDPDDAVPSEERLVAAIDVLEQARDVYGDQLSQAPIHTRLDELYRRLGALPVDASPP